jgi:hypothetical protein
MDLISANSSSGFLIFKSTLNYKVNEMIFTFQLMVKKEG